MPFEDKCEVVWSHEQWSLNEFATNVRHKSFLAKGGGSVAIII